jgi:hypothetical protein
MLRIPRIEALLLQISDPTSAMYSKYLSHAELIELVAPKWRALSKVHSWIESAGARVVSVADTRDFVTVRAVARRRRASAGDRVSRVQARERQRARPGARR